MITGAAGYPLFLKLSFLTPISDIHDAASDILQDIAGRHAPAKNAPMVVDNTGIRFRSGIFRTIAARQRRWPKGLWYA